MIANRRLFCFGLGYSAQVLARRLATQGWGIGGTCRTEAGAAMLRAAGFDIVPFSRSRPISATIFDGVSHLLASIPPDAEGDPVLTEQGAKIAALSGLSWVGYLSTTGVYGDRGGGWVDERTRPAPSGERGRRRVAAEEGWRALCRDHGIPVHIFRLAGIYGPGRSTFDALRAGTARRIDKPRQVFSRIHVDDLAQVLEASIARPRPGAIYNVCDDEPAPQEAVVAYAARLAGLPPPPLEPFAEADLSAMARSFYDDNKRVANARIKEELGVHLRYPDYRAGLAAILATEKTGGG